MKFKKGFFRLSIVLSIVLFIFLFTFAMMISPSDNELSLVCYEEIINCNQKDKVCLQNNKQFIEASRSENSFQITSLIKAYITQYKKYFNEQCQLENKNVCINPFDQYDCKYSDEEISTYYIKSLNKLHHERNTMYLIAGLIYIIYLALLLGIWWICLGFINQNQE